MTDTYWERMYAFHGRTTHLVHRGEYDGQRTMMSACGRYPGQSGQYFYFGSDQGWLGLGDQHEYDKAERLPLCKDCERIASVKKETVEEKNARLLAARNAGLLRRRFGS